MCGIAGIVQFEKGSVSTAALKRMTDAMVHRGPDGEGIYVDGNAGLGHRRLAIIDLSDAGHQPMLDTESRFAISYNGEVYNFREIRAELQALGHRFKSDCDTEVILLAYAEWRDGCVSKFNGMFAFSILDRIERTLFLARDRYGIKPLYYAAVNNTLLFASEIKSILADHRLRKRVNKKALLEYFTFQNLFTNQTLHEHIFLFPAGSHCTIRIDGPFQGVDPVQYWDFNFEEPETVGDEREYLEEVARLFRQAVNRQLVSDVEVGAYLSGGMDSGSVAAVASRQFSELKTFTCGFDLHSASGMELNFDEREKAEHMSYLFKTEHYEMVLKAGDMERCMEKLSWHLEDPRVGQSYPNFYAAKLASRFVKVVLAGTGSDEIFGGYPWRYYRAVVNNDFEHYIDKYYLYWQRLMPNQDVKKVFEPIWGDVHDVWTRDIFRDVFRHHADELTRPEDYINHSLYFEAKTFLHGLLLVEDKMSMAHSLECRVPFLDNDLVDFAMKLPVGLKLGKLDEVVRVNENEPGPKTQAYYNKTRDGKLLLRKMMEEYVPKSISEDIKQGFSGPDSSWFKGDSIEFVRNRLIYGSSPIYDYLDRGSVQDLVNDHLSGETNRRLLIWSLLSFDQWLRQ